MSEVRAQFLVSSAKFVFLCYDLSSHISMPSTKYVYTFKVWLV